VDCSEYHRIQININSRSHLKAPQKAKRQSKATCCALTAICPQSWEGSYPRHFWPIMTNVFNYSALPNDSIRLLTFSLNAAGDLICTMKDVVFANCPRFYALSYSWGSDASCISISCNGSSMNIRANLYDAIHTLFNLPLNPDLPIWIDAISINQDDDEEKAVQVSRMGDIYRTAHQVLAWLGPAEQNSDLAMDSLENLSKALPPLFAPPEDNKFEAFRLPRRDSPVWSGLGYLFCRTWFGRLWTFQEAVLASNLLIVCGRKTISSKILSTVAKELRRLGLHVIWMQEDLMKDHESGFHALEFVNLIARVLNDGKVIGFPYLLEIACRKACSDPRDRVFGWRGKVSKTGYRLHIRRNPAKKLSRPTSTAQRPA
jgi:hypothetical protein